MAVQKCSGGNVRTQAGNRKHGGSDAASGVTAVTRRDETMEVEAAEVRGGPAPVRWRV